MAVLETVASVLNGIFEFFAHVTRAILSVNYHFMTVLIGFMAESLSSVSCAFQAALSLFHCYFTDFRTFVEEFAAVLYLLIGFVIYLLHSLYVGVLSVLYSIHNILQFLLSAVHISGSLLFYVTSHITAVLVYISKLIFQAVILLLLLLPNAFLYFCNILLRGAFYIHHNFLVFWCHLKSYIGFVVHVVKIGSVNIFYSIPLEAYVGLLMLVILYYKREPVMSYSKKCILLLFYVLVTSVKTACHLLFTGFSHSLYLISMPFLWVLQLMLRTGENDKLRQIGFLCINFFFSKFSLVRVFCRVLGAVFTRSKSDGTTLNDPDQIMHLRVLEQKLNEERDRHLCVVCQDEVRTMLLLPCRHLCLCNNCWQSLKDHRTDCPVCRRSVYEAFHVFV